MRTAGRLRKANLDGTNLDIDPRTGNYLWRRSDEITGKRLKRSTRTPNLTIALRIAGGFEEEHQKRRAGLHVFDAWRRPLAPLADEWIASLRCRDKNRALQASRIGRAMKLLELTTAADLDDIPVLERRLLALERREDSTEGFRRVTLRRAFQEPLKQCARWLAGNRRYLDRNPLAEWEPLDISRATKRPRRAFLPEEVARALLAADRLDALHDRARPMRPVVVALLVGAPRVGALAALDVTGLDRRRRRLDLGPNVGKKHRGESALDATTFEEISAYVGGRAEGPLFLSPDGYRVDADNLRADWRAAFGLALVDELWPDDEPRDLATEYAVSHALATGKIGSVGGNPTRLRPETLRARAEREAKIRVMADILQDTWTARMRGVDVHAFRKTHRTWAEARGVHAILIDKQLGHSTPGGSAALEAARCLLASPTGRRHYVDMGLELLDARRSADAVRGLLDEAVAVVSARATALLDRPSATTVTAGRSSA